MSPPKRRAAVGRALALIVGTAIGSSCLFPGNCGGDLCLVYTSVSGRVTTPGGEPVAGLRLESQSATYDQAAGCDTTAMRTWYDIETAATGRYVLTIPNGSVDEVNCAFVRVVPGPGVPWNDTLVGPLHLGEFGTEPPEDTTEVDIVLQPAP